MTGGFSHACAGRQPAYPRDTEAEDISMKKLTLCSALAVCLTAPAALADADSVRDLLGLSVSSAQEPGTPIGTGHASAEESPFYLQITAAPTIAGTINFQQGESNGRQFNGGKVRFDAGVGFDLTFGYRIPDSYVILQLWTGFFWNGVDEFNGELPPSTAVGVPTEPYSTEDGNLYQIPVMFSPGLEFDLPGGWPFLSGGIIRFGPSVGVSYNDLQISNIRNSTDPNAENWNLSNKSWVFTYGAFLDIELFLNHNMALTIGYQFIATAPIKYGTVDSENPGVGNPVIGPEVKSNNTYTNIVRCGLSFYF
jgi:opacity protein-like surface antigen